MQKFLLTLGLFGLVLGAQAQAPIPGPWTTVNTTNVNTPPNYVTQQLSTVSATVTWGITEEAVASSTVNSFIRTNNAAGTEFDFNTISGTPGYNAANICGVSNTTAYVAQYAGSGPGGEILRTTNSGGRWTKVTTNTQFAAPAGFANWVHMFDANEGVALGDPNGAGFEVLRTTNTGTTWTRVAASNVPAPLDADEYGLVRSYFALGNTIWAGTSHYVGGNTSLPLPARILKSTDRGQTWTVANTPLSGEISRIAFKDQQNGIATTRSQTNGVQLIRTTDGGATWTLVSSPNTTTGKFYGYDIDATSTRFISVGAAVVPATGQQLQAADVGVSVSTDGLTWRNLENALRTYTNVDVLPTGEGYLGGFTAPTTSTTLAPGAGGLYRTNNILTARDAAVQRGLAVYPNPSVGGVFKVQLAEAVKAGTELTVADALGRVVYARTLNAAAVGSEALTLDLSKEKAGMYNLVLRTEAGIAQHKIVVE